MSGPLEIVVLTSTMGVLTKHISLRDDGTLHSDGSACVMARGTAKRERPNGLPGFATIIGGLGQNEAIALGALRPDLPDNVQVMTTSMIKKLNGTAPLGTIARTNEHICYRDKSSLALLDHDTKGMPQAVAERVKALGGFWPAVLSVAPELEHAGTVVRRSTSSGIVRTDTGQSVKGSDGLHVFVLVQDGTDIERFLRTLHERCWLHGLGWMIVGAGGILLDRSIIDRSVFGGERLVFEGPPVLASPLAQDAELRIPAVTDGEAVNTGAACRPLTIVEAATLAEFKAEERQRLGKDAAQARTAFVKDKTETIVARLGSSVTAEQAERAARRFIDGVLLPDVELPFDSPDLAGATVRDVLSDPDRFVDATLADPLEGVGYGRAKAKVMRRADGTLWINSFAHGRTTYNLMHDAAAVEQAMRAAPPAQAANVLVRLGLLADLPPEDEQCLRDLAVELSGVKARPLGTKIKQARAEQARQQAREERDQEVATRSNRDRRKRLPAPFPDAERLPIMTALDEVLCAVPEPEPPMRDMEGHPVDVRDRAPVLLHELTSGGANQAEPEKARLPAPTMPLLTRHCRFSFAHLVEKHIEWVIEREDADPKPVALQPVFIDHFMAYRDSALPRVGAVVTAPLVMPDGSMLAPDGLDRRRNLVFRIPKEMRAILPKPNDKAPEGKQVADAMDYLANDWLCDVATDFNGKCVLIALALSILERVLLPERPAFFVTAGKRGGGKTTALAMIILAVTGKKPAAAAWSNSEEERRKALGAYLAEGLAAMVFDNIPLGATVACPTIEKILTAESYSDRILGQTAIATVPAFTILTLTGNNIAPKGDLASRSLMARLDVDRVDPENRSFKHSDPIAWTLNNRGEILRALYVIMLGNPQLKEPVPPKTRFKRWWHLVGSAIENATTFMSEELDLPEGWRTTEPVSFVKLFAAVESEDEETTDLSDVLEILSRRWPPATPSIAFQASDVAKLINLPEKEKGKGAQLSLGAGAPHPLPTAEEVKDKEEREQDAIRLRAFFENGARRGSGDVSTITIGRRLNSLVDAPIRVNDKTMKLMRDQPAGLARRPITMFRVKAL